MPQPLSRGAPSKVCGDSQTPPVHIGTDTGAEDPASSALALLAFCAAPDQSTVSSKQAATATLDSCASLHLDSFRTVEADSVMSQSSSLPIISPSALSSQGNNPNPTPPSVKHLDSAPSPVSVMGQSPPASSLSDKPQRSRQTGEPRRHWSGVIRASSSPTGDVNQDAERRLRMNHLRRCNEDMRILMLGWTSIEVRRLVRQGDWGGHALFRFVVDCHN
jgi:hypothetical protein